MEGWSMGLVRGESFVNVEMNGEMTGGCLVNGEVRGGSLVNLVVVVDVW